MAVDIPRPVLQGSKALVVGIANDSSIAYGCAKAFRELGSLAGALGGLDALVFTGGIGENSADIRERVCRNAGWLGVALDEQANRNGGPRISTAASATAAWVVPTNEELMIARHTRSVLNGL